MKFSIPTTVSDVAALFHRKAHVEPAATPEPKEESAAAVTKDTKDLVVAALAVDKTYRTDITTVQEAEPVYADIPATSEPPAKAEEETTMSTAASPLATAATTAKVSEFRNILDHVKAFFGIALKDVIEYTPEGASLAEVLFPQYAGAIEVDKAILVGAATTIQNTVLTVEQKYSDAAKSDATNAAKLDDALAIITPTVIPTLQKLNVPVPATVTDIANKINATVAILKNFTVPVTATPSAQGV